jgi:hypothetical protein
MLRVTCQGNVWRTGGEVRAVILWVSVARNSSVNLVSRESVLYCGVDGSETADRFQESLCCTVVWMEARLPI